MNQLMYQIAVSSLDWLGVLMTVLLQKKNYCFVNSWKQLAGKRRAPVCERLLC